jgi:hypothetical protein
MAFDEDSRKTFPCPCGKGEIVWRYGSDDRGNPDYRNEMNCPECRPLYVHDPIFAKLSEKDNHGWVLESIIEEDRKFKAGVEQKAKELYLSKWVNCLRHTATKKDIWALKCRVTYGCSLQTYYKHSGRKSLDDLRKEAEREFHYYNLKRIFDVCFVKPDLDALVTNENDKKKLMKDLGMLVSS